VLAEPGGVHAREHRMLIDARVAGDKVVLAVGGVLRGDGHQVAGARAHLAASLEPQHVLHASSAALRIFTLYVPWAHGGPCASTCAGPCTIALCAKREGCGRLHPGTRARVHGHRFGHPHTTWPLHTHTQARGRRWRHQ
jgi:hypothetical protein